MFANLSHMKFLFYIAPLALCLLAFRPAEKVSPPDIPADVAALLSKFSCSSCHAADKKMVGPSWMDISAKKYSKKRFAALVAKPEPANWPGFVPMAPQPTVSKADLGKISDWVASLTK